MMVNNLIFSENAILRKCRGDVRKTNNVRNQFFLVGQDVSPSVCLKVFSFQKPTGRHFVPRVSKRKVLDNENVKLYTKSRNLSFSSSNLFRDYRYIKSSRSLVVKLRGYWKTKKSVNDFLNLETHSFSSGFKINFNY